MKKMILVSKYFEELSTTELYEILKARAEIFNVEQNCVHQDLDDIDYQSFHIFYRDGQKVAAYLRAFLKSKPDRVVKIGRVLTIKHGTGLGGKLLHNSIDLIKTEMHAKKIEVSAQCHAVGFYEREGFRVCSDEFLEDGIPHVQMELWV